MPNQWSKKMKRIINGKIYNTETATRIGNFASDCGPGDFRYEDTDLYRTKKGAFFLAGSGGPASKYAHTVSQNEWTGGSDLIALTPAEAQEWAENAGIDADEIAKYFTVTEA